MRLDHYFFQVQYVHNQKVSNARPPVDSAEEKVEGEGKEDDEVGVNHFSNSWKTPFESFVYDL